MIWTFEVLYYRTSILFVFCSAGVFVSWIDGYSIFFFLFYKRNQKLKPWLDRWLDHVFTRSSWQNLMINPLTISINLSIIKMYSTSNVKQVFLRTLQHDWCCMGSRIYNCPSEAPEVYDPRGFLLGSR